MNGLIFDIKRYAINDGPGIRIVIFFKGCNLDCAWCHNPEGVAAGIEKMYARSKCILCGTCVGACHENAITIDTDKIVTDTLLCTLCGKCAEVCPTKAIEMSGNPMSVTEIMDEIGKERIFFEQSGGGVTFSGGEPLIQSEILMQLLEECGNRGIHRTVDTAGHVKTQTMLEVASRTDLFLYDLKIMDPKMHERWCGVGNELILHNLKALSETGARIIIRVPLIGDVNDSEENIRQTAEFINSLAGDKKEVHLLPYHRIAEPKYEKLGRGVDFELFPETEERTKQRIVEIFRENGIVATVGG